MGRKRKGNYSKSNPKGDGAKKGNNDRNKKRQKRSKHNARFWIEQCKGRKVPKTIPENMRFPLLISRVQLTDGHMHSGKCPRDTNVKSEVENSTKTNNTSVDDTNSSEEKISEPIDQATETDKSGKVMVENATIDNDLKNESTCTSTETVLIDVGTVAGASSDKKHEPKNDATEILPREPFIQVIRAESAKGKSTRFIEEGTEDLKDGDCGDGIVNPFPKDEVADKYWAQRKRLFSKFDEGIKLDKESWYSVTPEAIAGHIAKRVTSMTSVACKEGGRGVVILDAFCGVGGNGIGFALHEDVSLVICVDTDREKLRMAANNAFVYNVDPSKILFIKGNAIDILGFYSNGGIESKMKKESDDVNESENCQDETCNGYKISGKSSLRKNQNLDCVFLSPPWGGMDYLHVGNSGYELSKCIKVKASDNVIYNGDDLLSMASGASKSKAVVYFLPKNLDGFNIGKSAWNVGYRHGIELEQNLLNGKLKTVTAYLNGF